MTPDPATSAANTGMIPIVPVSATAAAAPPTTAAAGSVSNQPYRIRRAVVQRTLANFLPTPEPMIEPEHTCVVDNPNPMWEDARMAAAEVVSAAKPCGENTSTMPLPIVRMIRQP